MDVRRRTEEIEHLAFAPWATFSDASRGRVVPEPQDPLRPVFQRDRDRVLHCKAFRRLKQKTQVFLSPEGDLYRTRLTHTLEVSQIARTIARALRLNEDLTEAISLAHDLGHTPFGHAGEQALNEVRAELKSQGYLKYYKQRERKQKPADFLRYRSSDGFEILIGRNNLQNDKLTLHTARGKDVWFHVQKAPGSHTVVMSRGEDVPDTTKQEAAELAVLHSSQNGGAKVPVDTTEVRNIWKANGARPGMVLYNDYTTVYITPRAGLEEQLREK